MRLFATTAAWAVFVAVGCGAPQEVAFEETRETAAPVRPAQIGMAESERLGLRRTARPASPSPAPSQAAQSGLTWDTPAGWREAPAESGMRLAAFGPETGHAWECVVFSLPGDAGGVRANLDRWRGQMGLEALTDTEFAGLPHIEILGRRVPLLEASGTYVGMGRSEPQPDSALLGTAVPLGVRSVFVKLTGEAGPVASEREAFRSFCRSLRRSRE